MKFFANTNIWKKIIIVFMVICTLSFVKPKEVKADFRW